MKLSSRQGFRRGLRVFRNSLIILLITLLAFELFFTVVDPYGIRVLREADFYNRNYIPHETRSYVLASGVYDFGRWKATVNEHYERLVPDSVPGCRVVFLGDSLTFGRGVDDSETFVNLLARSLRIDAVNTGVDAYNSENVHNTLQEYEADLFVWLIFDNDIHATLYLAGFSPMASEDGVYRYNYLRDIYGNTGSGIATYIRFLRINYPDTSEPERFARDMRMIGERDNIVMVAMDNAFGQSLVDQYNVHLIPPYTSTLSIADSHPDSEGHRQLAAGMLSVIEDAVNAACDRHSKEESTTP